jgi:hypothetical protein
MSDKGKGIQPLIDIIEAQAKAEVEEVYKTQLPSVTKSVGEVIEDMASLIYTTWSQENKKIRDGTTQWFVVPWDKLAPEYQGIYRACAVVVINQILGYNK